MGKETISSQELASYTHINSTQIRRDLSGFGKFGKRGVGYQVDSLVAEIRKILRSSGQHNIALFGAGNLGQAIASSDIFADHGFRIVSIFDVDSEAGRRPTSAASRSARSTSSTTVVANGGDRRRRPRGSRRGRPGGRRSARRGRGPDHLQLLRAAARGPARGDRPHLEPRRRPALRAVLLPRLSRLADDPARDESLDLDLARERFEDSTDFTVAIEEEFAIARSGDARARPRLRGAATSSVVTTSCSPTRPRRAS